MGPLVLARSGYVQRQNEYLRSVESTRMAVGRWLRQHTDPHAIVATGAIGHVGREAGRTILDHAGLVSAAEGPYDYVVGNDGYPGPADRYGAEAGFLRWNRLVAKFTPAPPFAHMTHKVYQHLSVASPLPEALLFRNGYLERPAELRLQGPILDLASSAAASHLAEGWSVPEPEWGTWATATTAALDLILELGLGTHVALTLAPFEVPGQVQHLAIEHNGRLVLPFTPLGPGFQTVGFDLDESGLDGGVQRLVLRTTQAVSPRELGRSDDSRTLAVVLRSLSFHSGP